MIGIDGLQHLVQAIDRLDLAPVQHEALDAAAQRIASVVRESLSHPPGSDHATPWMRTGTLHDSIEADATQDEAVIGSDDRVAVDQELGTRTIPPRPFLAPAAAREAEGSVRSVSEVIVNAIRGMLR